MREVEDPALLEAEIAQHLTAARTALADAGRLVRRLEQSAQAVAARAAAASAGPRLVKIRAKAPIGPDGKPVLRRRGRPKGARNRPALYATEAQIEALRSQLAQQ